MGRAAYTAIALLATGCAGTWETRPGLKPIAETLATGALLCDAGTTVRDQELPGNTEANPLLGSHPSPAAVFTYFGIASALLVGANVVLPTRWALLLDGLVFVSEGEAVAHNMVSAGVGLCGADPLTQPRQLSWYLP